MGISAQNYEHILSLGASTGLLYGQAEEIVFKYKNYSNKLSQLLWDEKPLVYAGLDIHYNRKKPAGKWSVFTDALFKFGFPAKTGIMEDRDWQDTRYPNFLTNYSVHDNETEKAVLININAGASFNIFEKILIKPFLSYNYMNFSWAASGGSLLYPGADGGHNYILSSGNVITYEQVWNIIAAGISFYGAFNRYFDINISVSLSPLIWCTAVDNHILRSLIFTDTLSGGFFIEPGLIFSFTPNDFLSVSLSVAYRNISGTRGDSKAQSPTTTVISKNAGGAGYSVFDAGIIVNYKLKPRTRKSR
jgi:outer membrane protease